MQAGVHLQDEWPWLALRKLRDTVFPWMCVCVFPSEPTIKLVMSWFMLAWDLEIMGNLGSKMGSEGKRGGGEG